MKDPIVEEVRRWRMEHTRKFDGDLTLIAEDLRRMQQASGCQVVRRAPKLLATTKSLSRDAEDRSPSLSPEYRGEGMPKTNAEQAARNG